MTGLVFPPPSLDGDLVLVIEGREEAASGDGCGCCVVMNEREDIIPDMLFDRLRPVEIGMS